MAKAKTQTLVVEVLDEKAPGLKLYPFQRSGINRMAEQDGVLLTDEMGLGKTVQVLTHIVEQDLFPAIIIPPKTLTHVWYNEIIKWFPEFENNITVFDPADPEAFLEWYTHDLVNGNKSFYIMWHDVMTKVFSDTYWAEKGTDEQKTDCVLDLVPKLSWKAVVVDEAHKFRNHNIQRAQGLLEFQKGKKILVTGTPLVNTAEDLWILSEMLGQHTRVEDFTKTFCNRGHNGRTWVNSGFQNREQFRNMIGDRWIRRTKAQVLKDLPEKQIHVMDLELNEGQREIYNRLLEAMFIEIDGNEVLETTEKLSLLMRMRQLAIDPRIIGRSGIPSIKTETILSIAEECHTNETKLVVYSNFKQYVNILERDVKNMGIGSLRITGDESSERRVQNQDAFQNDTDNKYTVMLLTDAGSLGITLTAADTVIVTDRWWNQVRVDQAIDRIHRIGQKNKVLALYLDCADTVDEYLRDITATKDASNVALIEIMRNKRYE